jgi:hypothetical protein
MLRWMVGSSIRLRFLVIPIALALVVLGFVRIREVLTGSGEAIVVRIFGDDLDVMRAKAEEVRQVLAGTEGVVDEHVDLPVNVQQAEVEVDLAAAQRYGIKPGDVRRDARCGSRGGRRLPSRQGVRRQRAEHPRARDRAPHGGGHRGRARDVHPAQPVHGAFALPPLRPSERRASAVTQRARASTGHRSARPWDRRASAVTQPASHSIA